MLLQHTQEHINLLQTTVDMNKSQLMELAKKYHGVYFNEVCWGVCVGEFVSGLCFVVRLVVSFSRVCTGYAQCFHKLWKSWKTWKITKINFMHGKIMELKKLNNHGKIMEFCEII